MLDFNLEMNTSWYCFTNVTWIKEKLKESPLKYTDDYESYDLCIVDWDYKFQEDDAHKMRINIDSLSSEVDCYICREDILDYLDLLQKSLSDADMNDIREVSRGALIEYVKISLKGSDNLDGIEELREILKGSDSNYGVLLFVSVGRLVRFEAYADTLKELYPNAGMIFMIPTGSTRDTGLEHKEKYAQVFVFKN